VSNPAHTAAVSWKFLATLLAALATAPTAAAAPDNDDLGAARRLAHLPARATGTMRDASIESTEPSFSCGAVLGTVWYRVRSDRRGPIAVELEARGELEAVVGVFRQARTRLQPVACKRSNTHGRLLLGFYGRPGREYLIGVGARRGSSSDDFGLQVKRPEPRALPPGRPLTRAARDRVHAFLDPDDAWSFEMARGRSYLINLLPERDCLDARLYRPMTYRFTEDEEPVAELTCGGSTLFTPGPDGGGRYSLLIVADQRRRAPQPYSLHVGPAEPDDVAPGISLGAAADITGTLSGRGIDLLDLYRFRAGSRSELDLRLRMSPKARFSIAVVRPTGEPVPIRPRLRRGRVILRHRVEPGHYYLAVRSQERSGGPYTLSVRVRGITATDMLIAGQRFLQVAPGEPQLLTAQVASAGIGGRVRFQFDRRDPFHGWQFAQTVIVPIGPSGLATSSWIPPGFGHWRVRARFLGSDTAAASESSYTRLFVAEPLEGG
jgi:hypothetical protein